MKKLLSFTTGILMFVGFANAQAGNVVITTTLTDVISLTIVIPAAAIAMTSADHYQNGTSTDVPAALTISTNQAWDLSVKAQNANSSYLLNDIPVGNFSVTVSGEADGVNSGATALTTTDQVLINGASGVALTSLAVNYAAAGGSSFIGTAAGAYTNTYVFTVSAD
jgi:hypothetical protein